MIVSTLVTILLLLQRAPPTEGLSDSEYENYLSSEESDEPPPPPKRQFLLVNVPEEDYVMDGN